MNANLIFKWLKGPRFTPDVIGDVAEAAPVFLPVEVTEPLSQCVAAPSMEPICAGRIEIDLAGGHCIRTEGGFDPDILVRLVKGLMA